MTAEEWTTQHKRYEKYAKPIFNRALKDSFANVKTMIPLINYENYQQLIVASFNFAPMQQAYLKVYTRVGLVQGNRIGRELNREQKQYFRTSFESTFMQSILEWVHTNLGRRIVDVNEYTIELIQNLVSDALYKNYSVSQMRAYLERTLNSPKFTRMRSLRIARTETTTAANHGAFQVSEESDLVLDKEWISVIDDRTRHDHLVENGQTAPRDENFKMADGSLMLFPGDPKGAAKQVINCRCTYSFVPRRDNNGMLIFKN